MTPLRRRLLIVVALSVLMCSGGFVLVAALTPPTVNNHYEGISWVLKRRNVQYTGLDAKLPWPEGLNYYIYGPEVYPYQMNVSIFMNDGRLVRGYMLCTRGMKGCSLDVPELAIDDTPTPDVRDGNEWPWLRWLHQWMW